jgi:nitrate reductase NapE component
MQHLNNVSSLQVDSRHDYFPFLVLPITISIFSLVSVTIIGVYNLSIGHAYKFNNSILNWTFLLF